MTGPDPTTATRDRLRRRARWAALGVVAMWAVTVVFVATNALVSWTPDACSDLACTPESAATFADARATDRMSRLLAVLGTTTATVLVAVSVSRAHRRRIRLLTESRRAALEALAHARRDFDDAAAGLAGVNPAAAAALLERLDRATDRDPGLDADFGLVVSGAIRHWDRCRRGAEDTDAAEWWEAVTTGVSLVSQRARPTPLDLTDVDLDGLRLPNGATLAGAVLHDVVLTEAGLAGVDLTSADLSGARLTGADLRDARLEGAALERTEIALARLDGADLMAVDATGADFDRSDLRDVDLSLASCRGASFLRSNLSGVTATRCDLTRARLHRADLRGATLEGAVLTEADLRGADLRGADLTGADLVGADLAAADLRGADLTGADLGGAWFGGAVHDETTRWPARFSAPPSHRRTTGGGGADATGYHRPNEFWDVPASSGAPGVARHGDGGMIADAEGGSTTGR